MRHPARRAAILAAVVASGVLLVRYGTRNDPARGDWTAMLLPASGFLAALIGTIFLIEALLLTRGRAKLLSGSNRLGRWTVSPADWDRFREFDRARSASEPWRLTNDLSVRGATSTTNIEVIVGKHSLIADSAYHVLRRHGLPELRGIQWLTISETLGCFEFSIAYPRRGGAHYMALRIPVPDTAYDEARQVYQWFEPRLVTKPGIALRNPQRTYRVCFVVSSVCFAAAAAGWAWATANGFRSSENEFLSILPLILVVAGIIFGIGSLLLALFTFLLTRGESRRA